MRKDSIIIFGSSRKNGNTAQLVSEYAKLTDSKVVDLSNYTISHFNYTEQQDDFIELINEIIQYKTVVLASPVYWYSVSSIMKTFLDRITELLIFNKDLGRQLRNKKGILLATGATDNPEPCFEQQIKLSFDYLGIDYKGMLYCFCENKFHLPSHQNTIINFITTNSHPNSR